MENTDIIRIMYKPLIVVLKLLLDYWYERTKYDEVNLVWFGLFAYDTNQWTQIQEKITSSIPSVLKGRALIIQS